MRQVRGCRVLVLGIVWVCAALGAWVTPAAAQPGECTIGVDVLALEHFDVDAGTFGATFWLWSRCPPEQDSPLPALTFVDATSVQMNTPTETVVNDTAWSAALVTGTFRHHWDVTRFPFDRQDLRITLEAEPTGDAVGFQADPAASAFEPETPVDGWRVSDLLVLTESHAYRSALGYPDAADAAPIRLMVTFHLERDDLVGFVKLVIVVYIAFLVSLIAYLLNMHVATMLTVRISLISGALFAIAVNLHMVTSTLGSDEGITLADGIHITALVAILVNALAALCTQVMLDRGWVPARVARFDRWVLVAVVVAFVVANAALIATAARG